MDRIETGEDWLYNHLNGQYDKIAFSIVIRFARTTGAPVAQWVSEPSSILTQGNFFSSVNGVPLHIAFHYHPNIVLI